MIWKRLEGGESKREHEQEWKNVTQTENIHESGVFLVEKCDRRKLRVFLQVTYVDMRPI